MKYLRFGGRSPRWRHVVFSIMLCIPLVTGCTLVQHHEYRWSEFEIDARRIKINGDLAGAGAVAIVNIQTDDSRIRISDGLHHKYYASLALLSGAIVTQLSDELRKRKFNIRSDGQKTLRVKALQPSVEVGTWGRTATIPVCVETGSGDVFERRIGKASLLGVAPRAFNVSIAYVVIGILNDPTIVAYLTSKAPASYSGPAKC